MLILFLLLVDLNMYMVSCLCVCVCLCLESLQQFLHDSVFCSWEPPRLHLSWEKHGKLLPEVLGLTAKRVSSWSTEEVCIYTHTNTYTHKHTYKHIHKLYKPTCYMNLNTFLALLSYRHIRASVKYQHQHVCMCVRS